MSATEIGSYVIDISAKISGYQEQIEKIKQALQQVGEKTDIGKGLKKDLAAIEKQVDSLAKHMNLRISSESQITRLGDSFNEVDRRIQKVGESLSKVKFEDLNADILDENLKKAINSLDELQHKLDSNMAEGFSAALEKRLSSGKLKEALESLKIDPKELNYENFTKVFSDGIEKNKQKVTELKEEIADLKKEQASAAANAKNYTALGNIDSKGLKEQLEQAAGGNLYNISKEALGNFEQQLNNYFKAIKVDDKILEEKIKPIINNITSAENFAQLRTNLDGLARTLSEELKIKIGTIQEGFKDATGIEWKNFINLDSFKEFDTSKLETIRAAIEKIVATTNNFGNEGSTATETVQQFLELFTQNRPTEAIESVSKALDEYITKMQSMGESENTHAEELESRIKELQELQKTLNNYNASLRANSNMLQPEVERLQQENQQLRQQLEQAKQEVENLKNNPVQRIQSTGESVLEGAKESALESAAAVQQYSKQLEAAKEAEKMVGKIEGIAQRWFSVYAAVRMVTNAINSMKKTIAELDKTITEIAIVTNMSQGDLWGQMGTYTQLAREYAASIQGVYQVSQLYYQQGLQTADVMALTESTLKMARISGLDYAEATDYMTNAVRSFKMEMEDAETVVDVYSAIAAKSATNVQELAVAMSKTASSAEAVGSSFQNTTAMMAVMIEATRESSQNIGSAMKSIISRYGELKENPAKLVDSEGEELSLNKVDKALQSVGITLHNAQGQFRDFDDVIEELAKSWDTIDINTQRYIATVMAGNRQQSRFLALVSNYDRYKELSEEAANAENAAQLQFLKTLDSIEAKTQQLQTSLQSLYTSSGLENFYKGILDISNGIIKAFTDMPTVFNLPIPAIINFGTTFYTLASIVKTVIQLVINEIAISATKIKNVGEKEISDSVQQNNEKLQNWKSYLQERLELYRLHVKDIIAAQKGENVNNLEDYQIKAIKEKGIGQNVKDISFGKFGLQIGSLVASAIGTTLKSNKETPSSQVVGGLLSAGSQAMQFGIMSGGNPIAIAAGAALGVIQNADSIFQTFEKRIANLSAVAEEANNKVLMEQAEAKSLQISIDKLKELEKTRYDSVEAEEAYLEASDTLAKQYPQLIDAYDETGKALINTESASQLLISSLKEVVNATEAASTANFKLALERYNKEQNEINQLKEQQPTEEINGFGSKQQQIWNFLNQNRKDIELSDNLVLDSLRDTQVDSYDIEWLFNQETNSEVLVNTNFSKYITDYLNNSFEEFSKERPKVDVSQLNKTEQAVYNYIEGLINQIASAPTREEANKKNFQASVKANIMSDINSYIALIQAMEDGNPFEGMSEATTLIKNYVTKQQNIEDIDSVDKWNQARSKAQETTQKYYDTLKEWYKDIDKETYKGVMAFKGKVSSEKLINMLREAFPGIENNIIEAFEETFVDSLDAARFSQALRNFDNFDIASILGKYSVKIFDKLSDAERQQLLNYSKQIEQSITSGALTQQQGENNLKAYLNIWQQLGVASITEEQRETAEELLRTWDGTKESLEAIKKSLPEGEAAKGVLEAIDQLIPLISQNLNTIFQNLSTSIATSIKNLDDAVKDLSKGVSIDKAVEYATKLGVDLSKFELDYSTGLWKYNDLNQIQQKYFENIDKQIDTAKTELESYTNIDNQIDIKKLIEKRKTTTNWTDINDSEFANIKGLNRGQIQSAIDGFIAASKETGNENLKFLDYIKNNYQDLFKILSEARTNAEARAALSLGDISKFVEIIGGKSGFINKYIEESIIANGKIDIEDIRKRAAEDGFALTPAIEKQLKSYESGVKTVYESITNDIYKQAIDSINKGSQTIEVTQGNRNILTTLGAKFFEDAQGKEFGTINWSELKVGNEQYNKAINELLLNGITDEEKSILEALEAALTNNNPAQVLDEITGSWQEVGQTAALLFKSAFDLSDTDFNKIFSFDEISKTYTTDLKTLREKIRNNNKLSQKQRNEQLAKIDKELRDTSAQTTFSDLVKNANNLSEETIRTWADSIGANYEVYANLWRQKDGTYKIDLAGLVQNKKALETLEQGGIEFAAGVLDSVIDEYLNQLSNISKAQTSGYTNLSDMRTVADQFANGDLGIFQWNKELKAYTLTNEGIMQQAANAANQLRSLDKDSQEYKKAWKLLQADGQALAENIDFLGLVAAAGTDEYVDASIKFAHSVEQYNAYLTGIGEKVGLEANELIRLAKEGSLSAVKAAQEIAERAGKKLEGSDIEIIYRSGANKINNAIEQINLSIGSIIDSSTVKLLGLKDEVSDLGSGKYVIQSTIDVVNAYKKIYEQMNINNGTTLSEFNALWAKIKNAEEQTDLIDSLSNLNEMSYDTLAQIANNIGMAVEDLYATLQTSGSMQNLGGGKIRITDFDYFANLIGLTDKSSEAYIQTLSKYNDEVISYNRSRAEAVVSELKAVSEAKPGDQVNITNLWNSLTQNVQNKLELLLLATGAEINNGIINLNDASIAQVLEVLRSDIGNIEGIAERDKAEIEDAFEALLNNITNAIKQGLEGKLSKVGKVDLQESLKNTYGIELKDSDFIKTAEGWQLAADAAFEVVDAMQQMDALQGNLVLKELRSSLKEAKFELTDMYSYAGSFGYKPRSGNVDLIAQTKHKKSAEELKEAGYNGNSLKDYGKITHFTYNEGEKTEKSVVITLTPITNDGKEINSPDDVTKYIDKLFTSGKSAQEILDYDKAHKNLLIDAVDVKNGEDLNRVIKEAHINLEKLSEESDNLSKKWQAMSEINLMEATSKNDALDFMNNKLPDALENPLKYAENWGKAINILQKGSGDKKGFIDARDWYNIVNEMNHIAGMGGEIKMYGVQLNGSLESASELIQKGYNALKSIDGGKMQVDLSQLGVAFETGAMDMEGSITKGIRAMANSQIEMLDGLIAVLETVVAMQEAFAGLEAGEDGQLDFSELFDQIFAPFMGGDMPTGKFTASDQFKTAAERLLTMSEGSEDLKKALEQVKINDQDLATLYKQAAEGAEFTKDQAQALASATNALYKASLSGNYDTDNIYESVKEVLLQSGLDENGFRVDIGDKTLYLTGNLITEIDWKSDKVKDALKNFKGSDKEKKKAAQAAMEAWKNEPLKVEGVDLDFILESNPNVKVELGQDGKKKYTVGGQEFDNPKDAGKALYALQHGGDPKKLTYKDEKNKEGVTGYTIETSDGVGIEVNLDGEDPVYKYEGFTGSSVQEVIEKYLEKQYTDAGKDWNSLTDDEKLELEENKAFELGVNLQGGKRKGSFKTGKNFKPTMTDAQAFQDWFGKGDFSEESAKEFLKSYDITVGSEVKGELTPDQLKELAEKFGVDAQIESKSIGLNVDTTGIDKNIADFLFGEEPITREVKLKVTGLEYDGITEGESIEGEDGNGGEGTNNKKPLEISAPVHLSANPLEINPGQDGPTGGSTAPIDIKGAVALTPTVIIPLPYAGTVMPVMPQATDATGGVLLTPDGVEIGTFTLDPTTMPQNTDATGGVNLTPDNVSFMPYLPSVNPIMPVPTNATGGVLLTPSGVQIGTYTLTTTPTMPSTTPASGDVNLAPDTIKVGSYDKEADISAILTGDNYYDPKAKVTAIIDLLGLKVRPGTGGEGEGGEVTTPVEGLPSEVITDKGVKFGVTSDGITISGTADDTAAAAFINSQLQTFAATLIGPDVVADTNGSVKLLVGLSEIFTDSTLDLSNLVLPAKLQAQLNSKLYTPEQSLMIRVLISSITSSMESGGSVKDVDEKGKVSFHNSPFTLPPIIQSILDAGQYTPNEQIQLLLAIKSASAAAENAGMKPNITGIAGLTGSGSNLSYTDFMKLILKISEIDPQNQAEIPDYSKAAGVENKTITVNQVTIIVPYKVKLNPEGSLPTADSFDLDSTLSNVRGYENGYFNMETYLGQGDSRQEQIGNLGKYLAEIGKYKKQGGIFSEETQGNFDALNTYFEGLGDNIPEELQGIAAALQVINSIEPGNIEDTGSSITDLAESPALQDDTTAKNLTSLGEGILTCCQIDVGHLQQFYHVLEDLPGAAKTFINDANWQEVVKIFKMLNELSGKTPSSGGAPGEGGEGDNEGEGGELAGPKTIPIKIEIILDELGEAIFGSSTTTVNVKTETETSTETPTPESTETPTPETKDTTNNVDVDASKAQEGAQQVTEAANAAGEAMEAAATGANGLAENTGAFDTKVGEVAQNVTESGTAANGAVGKLDALTQAINRIPDKTTIEIGAHVDLEVTASIKENNNNDDNGGGGSKGNADVDIKMGETSLSQSDFTIAKSKGSDFAYPKGNAQTLMGELGPELFVANGRYQVVGQHGAEFVDLPKDAIVFNHKKTAQLLKNGKMSGRGKPFTNISNALSFAKGTSGPAMASASAALAALKQLRAMWASMLNASAKDLGSQAGRGGGGGGDKDENGNYRQPRNVIKEIERWYNLERQIANLEKEITYQQKLQSKYETDRIANGEKIYDTYKKQLEALEGTIVRQRELSKLQRSWYDAKRKELEESSYGKIFTYDENGLQQYVGTGKPGSGLGLDILENLTRRNVNGQAIGNAKTAKSQLKYLQSVGFNLNDLIYNDDGTKVVKKISKNLRLTKMEGDEDTEDEELYEKLMENFWNNLDGWKEELDSLYDGIQDTLNEIEENQKKQNEILNKLIDNDIDIRNKLKDAIINREQAVIDKLQEQKDAIEESTERFIDGLNEALERDRELSEQNKENNELTKLQRQLAILLRSGGSAAQIKQLQDQINQKQEDMYFDERQKQIDAIQEASDKEIERLDQQIDLLSETLEFQKDHGFFWDEVENILSQGIEPAAEFYKKWMIDNSGEHALAQENTLTEFIQNLQTSKAWHEDQEKEAEEAAIMESTIANHATYAESNNKFLSQMTEDEAKVAKYNAEAAAKTAKEEYLKEHLDDEKGATEAAAKAYNESLYDSWKDSDVGKDIQKNFNESYDTWLKNRQLSDANDFTNKSGFEKYQAEFKRGMLDYYLQHRAVDEEGNVIGIDEDGNKISEAELWQQSVDAGRAAIIDKTGEVMDAHEGTLKASAALYNKTTYKNKKGVEVAKMEKTDTSYPSKTTFTFDKAKKIGSYNYFHIKGQPDENGWIRASQVKNARSLLKLIKNEAAIAEEAAGAVTLGDSSISTTTPSNDFIELDVSKYDLTSKDWFNATTVKDENNNDVPLSKVTKIKITDAKGLKFNDTTGKLSKTGGTITIGGVSLEDGKMINLKTERPVSVGKGKKTLINEQINSIMYNVLKYLMAYKEGGMAYATGPAWLDGTKTKPEAVLNAKQTDFLKNDLLGNQNDSLKSIVTQLQEAYQNNPITNSNIVNKAGSIYVDKLDVVFESGVISNDYDMKRASDMFKNELLRMARKTTSVSVSRR